ncbi:GNAT family N-acetyltransferase [Actinoplanes sp. M2I2]|uniref:GNAT family N-acetyltransferase n=1 Tax=Actinoplanes sp. M2I2 TaxID=1734444 RepID=UPI0020226D87|nr:GNAT family N-acetyltransferase [Actinoplanes sp. M2I2]
MQPITTAQAEAVEAEFMYQYESGAPAEDREALGITVLRSGGGVVLSAPHDPTGYWSKALGFGFVEPVTGELVDRVLDVYRARDNKVATLQIAPEALPADWDEICRTRGLEAGGGIVKLAAPIETVVPAGSSDLRVAPVTKDDAERWAATVLDGFGFPHGPLLGLLAAVVDHPRFHPYAVWDGDTIVGGGNLYVHGDIASLNTGSILPSHRNRGGQTMLVAGRVARARELGCRWVVTEAGQPADGESNPSLNNLLRAGLRRLYVRTNYLWHA